MEAQMKHANVGLPKLGSDNINSASDYYRVYCAIAETDGNT